MDSDSIDLTCTDASLIQDKLDRAAETLRARALNGRPMGIVVTRLGPGRFRAFLSPEVPYGMTVERDG